MLFIRYNFLEWKFILYNIIMAKVNTVSVPTAIEGMNRLNLNYEHVTTSDFMRLQPVGYRHMPKTEHYRVNVSSTVNPLPIQLPVYGRVRQNVRAFFVPYRLVMPQWHKFFNDELASNFSNTSLIDGVPFFTVGDLVAFLINGVGGTYRYVDKVTDASAIANGDYDIELEGQHWNFNALGRRVYSFLLSLGYCAWGDTKNDFRFNCLALFAYAKLYIDWFANPQYLNSIDVIRIQQILSYNDPTTPFQLSAVADFITICEFCTLVCYDQDEYFNYAWDNPVSPNTNQFSQLTWNDPTSSNISVEVDGTGTALMRQNSASITNIGSQTSHEFLRRISEYQKRHQLAGARSIDRVLLQFGIVSDYLRMERSIYVGNFVTEVKIGNVYATANGSNGQTYSTVGDYAGVGFGKGQHTWEFKADEEGIFIVVHSLVPSGGFYQGYDRNNRCFLKSDFYNPEYDSSVQIIEKGEVYVSKNQGFIGSANYDAGFGVSGKYAEKKFSRNFVTGDIRFFSGGAYGDAWHLMRTLNDSMFGTTDGLVHSNDFARGTDRRNYDRIFQYTGNEFDHFICDFFFEAHAYSPLKPAFETFDFESDKNKITIQTNGSMVN